MSISPTRTGMPLPGVGLGGAASSKRNVLLYQFFNVGSYPNKVNNPQAEEDLESGFCVRCPRDPSNPNDPFKADLYITGIPRSEAEASCKQVKEEVLKLAESAFKAMEDAKRQDLGPNCDWDDAYAQLRYFTTNYERASKPLSTPTVFRAVGPDETYFSKRGEK